MKKVLIGLAAGALAVTAMTAPVSAGTPSDTVYDLIIDNGNNFNAETLIDASTLAGALSDCGNTGNNNGLPDYTIFFPSDFGPVNAAGDTIYDTVVRSVLASLDITEGELYNQPALIKAFLLNHVVKANISPEQLTDNSNTVFNTMGGLTLVKTGNGSTGYFINGYAIDESGEEACNGWVYGLFGALSQVTAKPTNGTTTDGSTVPASGEGLPATGSESLALTYAALASLIAGAGVLVIRRRSVA